jgi:CRISPR/Cas system CMR subunit Cmr6 (Cas7 group RAMP superfamily)
MIPGIPLTFGSIIHEAIRAYGDEVIYRSQRAAGVTLRALVQQPADRTLLGDASQDGMVVYLSAVDVPTRPEQFDRIVIAGQERTIDSAEPEGANSQVYAWRCWVIG